MTTYQPWVVQTPLEKRLIEHRYRIEEENERLREELARAREVVRAQGEFIQRIKRDIRDFLVGDEPVVMQRAIADQGFRVVPSGSASKVKS